MKKLILLFSVLAVSLISCQKELIEINQPKKEVIQNSDVEKSSTTEKGFRFDVILSEASTGTMTIVHGSEVETIPLEDFKDSINEDGMSFKYFSHKKEFSRESLRKDNLIEVYVKLDNEIEYIVSQDFINGNLGLSPMNLEATIFERSSEACSYCSQINSCIIIPRIQKHEELKMPLEKTL